ncbi:glucokinase [Bacillus manliponensis]|uniref:Glucokinase n=1 Tax=Bacillus manliponensis TaxID=574376 RepID=A0A073JUN8_9BACI|nr:ROK family protein [Bacillus manliponensis]KEK18774.1 glucokinase [Bacillus manliponensis]
MEAFACFDIGGTFIKYTVMNEEGELYEKGKIPTPAQHANEKIPYLICETIRDFGKRYLFQFIGVSSCGIIDKERGKIVFSANIPSYSGTKIVDYIYENTGYKAIIENDVRSACIGEMWKGAGQGTKNIVLLTLGTGIGSGIVINGHMLAGEHGLAGELGHMTIVHNGKECSCGNRGCLEQYASTLAFTKRYIELAHREGRSVPHITGEDIMERVRAGEKLAKGVYKEFIQYIITGLVNITHMLNPEMIIIGGGIAEQGEQFLIEIQKGFQQQVMSIYQNRTKIMLAELGNDAGVYGAGYIAMKQWKRENSGQKHDSF